MVDKKALKDAGKKYIKKLKTSFKNVVKQSKDPFGVEDFVSDYKKSRRKSKVSKSRMAQRTGNKYMVDKGTTYVKPKAKARNLGPVKPTPKKPSSSESANTKKQRQLRKLHQLKRLKITRK
jgi:hypothetical protein